LQICITTKKEPPTKNHAFVLMLFARMVFVLSNKREVERVKEETKKKKKK
jgi:hypothetical protein